VALTNVLVRHRPRSLATLLRPARPQLLQILLRPTELHLQLPLAHSLCVLGAGLQPERLPHQRAFWRVLQPEADKRVVHLFGFVSGVFFSTDLLDLG
jgi:hypothetical protein